MTIREIQKALRPWKKVRIRMLRNYIKICGIEPLGARQRPQQYPDNAAAIILKYLGLGGERRKAA